MDTAKPVVADLESMIEVAEQGIVSKAIVENEHHKIIQFTLAAGQELSEHTASVPAVIHVLQGQGTVSLGGDVHEARPGMLYYMPAEHEARGRGGRRPGLLAHHVPDLRSAAPAARAAGERRLDVTPRRRARRPP